MAVNIPAAPLKKKPAKVKPQPIWMPVCPECGRVGSQPGQKRRGKKSAAMKFHCLGWEVQHSKAEMVMVEYRPKGWRK